MRATDLLAVLDIEVTPAPKTEPKLRRARPRRAPLEPISLVPMGPVLATYVQQFNEKRVRDVATRAEVECAIERLLESGQVAIVDGRLRLTRRRRHERITREQQWARKDDEARLVWQRIETHETRGTKARESVEMQSAGSMWALCAARATPRNVDRYVLRELRSGPADYAAVVETIADLGGLEDVAEERRRVGATGRGKGASARR